MSLTLGGLSHTLYAQNWVQRGSDLDGATLESIGLALSFSADGTVVAIGANANDQDPGNSKSSVKVRMWNGSAWVQKGSTLYAEQAGDNFGTALSLSANGNVLAVGARTHSDIALYGEFSFSGRAYVYDWSGTDWVLRSTALIAGAAQENFGNDVSLSQDGNLLAVGAPGAGSTLRGLVRIYSWSGASWSQVGSDLLGDTDYENFGTSVSLKVAGPETVLAIGSPSFTPSPGSDYTGRVKIFNRSGNSWNLSKTLTGDNTGDYFGFSVSLSNDADRLAIGAPTDGIFSAQFIGYARTFDFTGSDWTQSGSDIVSNIVFDEFGKKLALSGDGQYLIIGARGGTGNENGRAEVYTFNTNTWQQVGSDIIGEAQNDLSGEAVAINDDGTVIAIGAPANSGNGISSGHVRIFDPGCLTPAAPTGSASQVFCSGATIAQLAATGTNIQWYDAGSGGTLQNGTTALVNNTIYYASQTVGTCESTARLAVTVTINTTPAPSGNATQNFCSASTIANLVATGTDIKWYDAASNGNLLAGSTALVNNTTYFASQTLSGCESTRLAVSVTVNTVAAPGSLGAQLFCNSATVADLTADGTNLKWYDVATGGTPLSGSQALDTNVELVFYASQTVNGCESADRVAVAAGVYLISAPMANPTQVLCDASTIADLAATPMDGAEIMWYANATGGTVLPSTTELVNGTTYYAEQLFSTFCPSISRSAVTVELLAVPTTPVSEVTQPTCSTATGAITITTQNAGETYSFNNGTDYQSSNVKSGLMAGDYQVRIKNSNGCVSASVTVTIATQPITPAAPVVTLTQPSCTSAGTITVTVQQAGDTYSFNNGTDYQSSNIKSGLVTGDYQVIIKSSDGCSSVATIATVNAPPAIPVAPTGNATQDFCFGSTVAQLTAMGTFIRWYAAETGGTPLATTTALTANATYYASQTVDCESTSRLAVTVTLVKCDQTITFDELPVKTFGDGPFTLEATTTSLLAITYTSSNTNVATIDGDQLTIVGAGTTTITASQAGDANYNAAAAVERSLTVNKASQSISGFDLLETYDLANGNTLTLSATAPSGQVTFSSSNTSVATVDGNTLNLVAPGSVTITALAAETNNYLQASATATIDVTDSRAILEIEEIDFGLLLRGETLTLAITVTNSGPGVATITNVTVPAGFTVTPTSFTLADDATRDISITFSPTIVRDYSGTLTLTTNASNNTKPITAECVYITELEEGADINTMAYPNPGNGIYTISSTYEKQVTIITSAGVAFQREAYEVAPRLMSLDLTDMPNGLYVLRLRGQGKTTTIKVIKK